MADLPLDLVFTTAENTPPAVRACELDVLSSWYGDTPELIESAYGPYEEQTAFLSVRRQDGIVVGACRLILPGPLLPKTVCDVAAEPWRIDAGTSLRLAGVDARRTWDIATIAVRRDRGEAGGIIAAALYWGLIHGTRANEIPWVLAVIDRHARSLLAMLGLTLTALPGTAAAAYMGSPACTPVWAHVPTGIQQQRLVNPDGHRLVSMGRGLSDVRLPDPHSLRLRRPTVPAAPRRPVDLTGRSSALSAR